MRLIKSFAGNRMDNTLFFWPRCPCQNRRSIQHVLFPKGEQRPYILRELWGSCRNSWQITPASHYHELGEKFSWFSDTKFHFWRKKKNLWEDAKRLPEINNSVAFYWESAWLRCFDYVTTSKTHSGQIKQYQIDFIMLALLIWISCIPFLPCPSTQRLIFMNHFPPRISSIKVPALWNCLESCYG